MSSKNSNFAEHENNFILSDDNKSAKSSRISFVVMDDCVSRLFNRRAMVGVLGSNPLYKTMLVAEVEGLKIYVKGIDIVITKENLRL